MDQEGAPISRQPSPFRRNLRAVLLIILVTLALRVPLLDIPLERDEGEYAYIGWRLGHHELPYRDWVDQKPPGIFWVYQLALGLPLKPLRAIHLAAALYSCATACALYFLARRFTSQTWAVVAAVLFALLSAHPLAEGTAANTELFMLLPLILSLEAFLRAAPEGDVSDQRQRSANRPGSQQPGAQKYDPGESTPHSPSAPLRTGTVGGPVSDRRRVLFSLLCGAFTGIAVAFKQVGAVNWPFLVVLYPIVFGGEKRLRNSLSFAIWSGLGAAGVWAIIAIYFSLHGGLNDLIYCVLTHNLEYVQALPWSERLSYLKSTLAWLSHTQAAAWIFAAAGAVALARARRTKLLLLLLGWTACSLVGVSASGQFFPHYFEQLLPAVCVMASLGGEALAQGRFWGEVSAWGRTGIVCAMLAALPLGTLLPFLFSYTPAQAVQKIYPGDIFAETPLLASRLVQATAPQERVFVFGTEPEVLFYAQRVSATRYIFLYPLYGPYRGVREKQEAAARQIELNRPAAVAYIPNGVLLQSGSEQFFTQWTETYLRENFRGDGCVTRDPVGDAHFLTSADGKNFPIPAGHQMIGAIFVRHKDWR